MKLLSLRRRAEQGFIDAMYEYGLAVDDPAERRKWLRAAADLGYIPAMYEYALVAEAPGLKLRAHPKTCPEGESSLDGTPAGEGFRMGSY